METDSRSFNPLSGTPNKDITLGTPNKDITLGFENTFPRNNKQPLYAFPNYEFKGGIYDGPLSSTPYKPPVNGGDPNLGFNSGGTHPHHQLLKLHMIQVDSMGSINLR